MTTAIDGSTTAPTMHAIWTQPLVANATRMHPTRTPIAIVYCLMRRRRSSSGDGGSEVIAIGLAMMLQPTPARRHGRWGSATGVRAGRADADRVDRVTQNRVVLITGGNRGIGRAIAEAFVEAGARVAVTARSGEGPAGTLTVRADVTDPASIDAAFTTVEAELGPVEVVIANAGVTRDTLLLRMSDDDFTSVVDTNLAGAFRVVKRASKGMLKARFGRVVLISSVVGLLGSAGQINYSASKAGLVGIARSLTRELGARGITANVVAPGFIETDMTAELPPEQQAAYLAQIPAGRFASAQEVAKVVVWLASDDAGYISGAVIPVDGGLGMGH